MDKLKMETPDLTEANIEKIGAMFPNVITETVDAEGKLRKAINFELLKQMLSSDVLEGDEAYEFTWVGKKASIVEANKPIRKTLRPCKEESKDWDTTENLYIEGDNLDVLKLLQESYLGKVKMIYIDPPYNTGSDSFIYPDNFSMEDDEYVEEVGLYSDDGEKLWKENNRANAQFHSKWCSMIYQRLLLARNILCDEGAIFIHIDEHEVYALSMICNEVFGAQNELGTIIWDKRNPKGAVAGVAYQHESILVYCKNISVFAGVPFQKSKENADDMMRQAAAIIKKCGGVCDQARAEYKEWIKDNKHRLSGGEIAYNLLDNDGSIYQPVSMAAPDKPETRSHRPLIHPVTGKPCPVPAKGWRFPDSTMDNLLGKNKIEFGVDETTQPRQKYYLKENMDEAVASLLYYGGSDDALGLPFGNPKPVYVAKKLIGSFCKGKDDIIMDFFSGSATVAHATMELNAEDGKQRIFIMVQYPEHSNEKGVAFKAGYKNICEIGKERIRRAGEKIRAEIIEQNKVIMHDLTDEITLQKALEANTDEMFDIIMAAPVVATPQKKVPDIGFRVLKLDDSNMKDVYYSPNEYSQSLLAQMESNIKDDRTDLDLLFGCLLEWGLPLSMPYTSETVDGCTIHTYNNGDLMACFNENVPESVIREIAGRKPLRVVFRDSSFASSPEKINVEEIFKLLAPNTSVKVL